MSQINNENVIRIIVGPMYAGKSSDMRGKLTRKLNDVKYKEKNFVLITHRFCEFITHKNKDFEIFDIDMMKLAKIPDLTKYDYIFIDEYQFFEDLPDKLKLLPPNRKKIYLYGLDTNFEQQTWNVYNRLLNEFTITQRKKLSGKCEECGKLSEFSDIKDLNLKKDIKENGFQPRINIKYIPLCSDCYKKRNSK